MSLVATLQGTKPWASQGRRLAWLSSGSPPWPRSHRSKAQGHLTTATTLYREMKMSYCLERMETERAEPS